jgi:hypothetical protein
MEVEDEKDRLRRRFSRQPSYGSDMEEEVEEKPKTSSPLTVSKVLTRTVTACMLSPLLTLSSYLQQYH